MILNESFEIKEKMSQFPLYITMMTGIPDKDLTVLQKKEFIEKVSTVDSDTYELIYALIKCFYIENSGEKLAIPYKGFLSDKGVNFDLSEFPNKLRQLLYKFVNAHKKKLLEDESYKKN